MDSRLHRKDWSKQAPPSQWAHNLRSAPTMKSIIRSLRPRVAKTVVNKNYTAVSFVRLLLSTVLSYLATHGSSPSIFGPEYHSGHTMISTIDLPYAVFDTASTMAHSPDLESMCGSTGIINVGVCSKHIVLKYKWLVSAPRPAARSSYQPIPRMPWRTLLASRSQSGSRSRKSSQPRSQSRECRASRSQSVNPAYAVARVPACPPQPILRF